MEQSTSQPSPIFGKQFEGFHHISLAWGQSSTVKSMGVGGKEGERKSRRWEIGTEDIGRFHSRLLLCLKPQLPQFQLPEDDFAAPSLGEIRTTGQTQGWQIRAATSLMHQRLSHANTTPFPKAQLLTLPAQHTAGRDRRALSPFSYFHMYFFTDTLKKDGSLCADRVLHTRILLYTPTRGPCPSQQSWGCLTLPPAAHISHY